MTISGNLLRYETRGDFWSETEFTVLPEHGQIHATILQDSSEMQMDKGSVVVALFKVEGDALTLGVANSFKEPPSGPVDKGWDKISEIYELKRSEPGLWRALKSW